LEHFGRFFGTVLVTLLDSQPEESTLLGSPPFCRALRPGLPDGLFSNQKSKLG
jgi:hypothetical protein